MQYRIIAAPVSWTFISESFQIQFKIKMRVSSELGADPEQVWAACKHPIKVKAPNLMCYGAVRKLGFIATELSKKAWRLTAFSEHLGKGGKQISKSMRLGFINE